MARRRKFDIPSFASDAPMRVFDWVKAARLLKEHDPKVGIALLKTQRDMTGGIIWQDHGPVYDSYTFLWSAWDIPVLDMDGEIIDCWVWSQDTPDEFAKHRLDNGDVARTIGRWRWNTKWPNSALAIVKPEDMERSDWEK